MLTIQMQLQTIPKYHHDVGPIVCLIGQIGWIESELPWLHSPQRQVIDIRSVIDHIGTPPIREVNVGKREDLILSDEHQMGESYEEYKQCAHRKTNI